MEVHIDLIKLCICWDFSGVFSVFTFFFYFVWQCIFLLYYFYICKWWGITTNVSSLWGWSLRMKHVREMKMYLWFAVSVYLAGFMNIHCALRCVEYYLWPGKYYHLCGKANIIPQIECGTFILLSDWSHMKKFAASFIRE